MAERGRGMNQGHERAREGRAQAGSDARKGDGDGDADLQGIVVECKQGSRDRAYLVVNYFS